jgi:hypothetical protein
MPMSLMSFALLYTIPGIIIAGMAVLVWLTYAGCGNGAPDARQSLSRLNPGDDSYVLLFATDNVTV